MSSESEYLVRVVQEPMTLYRACFAGDTLEAMRSNYERGSGRNPRDLRATVLHMAVSMFDTPDALREIVAMFPKLGTHIAQVDIQPEAGVCVADAASPGHWSVWGRPSELAGFVSDVVGI